MLKNQLTIAIRNILRQKGYTFINIMGLCIGIACCVLILLYVQDEMTYDRYNEKADRIYRIMTYGLIGPSEFRGAVTPAPMGPAFVEEIPEVESAVRIRNFGFPVLRYEDKVFSEENFYWADSTIFDIFTIPFVEGNPDGALDKPNTMVMTESMALKYFGDENPVGKLIQLDKRTDYLVTGVIKDFPHNSHFHFDFIGSLVSYQREFDDIWISNNFYTYVLLKKGATQSDLESKFPHLVEKYAGPQLLEATGYTYQEILDAGNQYSWSAQPLTDIHLHSNIENEIEPNGNAQYVYIFLVVAFGILIIACINFMNLATARSTKRAREVGIRKTLGSTKTQLIAQFITEGVLLTFIALAFALILIQILLPFYNNLIEKKLTIDVLFSFQNIIVLILLTLFIGISSSIYPAFFMSSFNTSVILKGNIDSSSKPSRSLRSSLVVFQFGVSVILIAGTLVISNQLSYLQSKNLGFNKDQLVIIEKTDDIATQLKAFETELRSNPAILNVTNSTHYIGQSFSSNAYRASAAENAPTHIIWQMFADENFLSTYQIKMAEGRFYSKEFGSDTTAIVINQAAAALFGYDDPIGKEIIRVGPTQEQSIKLKIIGILDDFNFESLHHSIKPLTIRLFRSNDFGRYVSVRIAHGNYQSTLGFIENSWKKFAGNQAFEYFFFDQEFNHLYISEQRTRSLMGVFSILAIFVASLGLFGLASYSAQKRTKEIGVRKVMGATVINIVLMMFRDTARLILIANIIALPVVYFLMRDWLQNFAYKIDVGWITLLVTVFIAFTIAILTVSYQAIRVALTNPADALRYE